MRNKLFVIPVLVAFLATSAQATTPLGTAFSYQGKLTQNGVAANGNFDMQFYLRDAATGGNPVAFTNTLAPVVVVNGTFNVTLDFGSVFTGQSLWLEIAVRTNGSTVAYSVVAPRQQLTPSPNAIYASLAGGATSGAITSTMLANGAVTSQQLASTIALGSSSANGRLDLYRNSVGGISMQLLGGNKQFRIFGDDSTEKASLDASPGWGELVLHNNTSVDQFAAILTANSTNGGSLTLYNGSGQSRASLFGANGGGTLNLWNGSGTNTITLFGSSSTVSTYGTDSQERVRLWGPAYGELLLFNGQATDRAAVRLSSNGGAASLDMYNGATDTLSLSASGNSFLTSGNLGLGTTTPGAPLHILKPQATARLETTGSGNGSVLELKNDTSSPTFLGAINFLDPLNNVPGQIAYAASGEVDFRVAGTKRMSLDSFGYVFLYNDSGWADVQLWPSLSGGATLWFNKNSVPYIQVAVSTTSGGTANFGNLAASTTVSIVGDDGTGHGLITTSVLQITGGADLSEQFDVRDVVNPQLSDLKSVQPGMVVCIDPENPGRLVVSTKPYDRTVAGIISGAGGIKPGMLMGQRGTIADGKRPIALTGRVYCLADASTDSIEPGDLLTTSATPGHAMKVTKPAHAPGAILGKAMSPLANGKGLVLVLVSLQ